MMDQVSVNVIRGFLRFNVAAGQEVSTVNIDLHWYQLFHATVVTDVVVYITVVIW